MSTQSRSKCAMWLGGVIAAVAWIGLTDDSFAQRRVIGLMCTVVEDNPQFSVAGASAALDAIGPMLAASRGAPLVSPAFQEAVALLHSAEDHLTQIANHWALNPAGRCQICSMKAIPPAPPMSSAAWQATRLKNLAALVYGEAGHNAGLSDVMAQDWRWCTPDEIPDSRPGIAMVYPTLGGTYVCERVCAAGGIGKIASVTQQANTLVFTNEFGSRSSGYFESQLVVVAKDWGNLRATVKNDGNGNWELNWANGTVWRPQKAGAAGGNTGARTRPWWYISCGGFEWRSPAGPPLSGPGWKGSSPPPPDGSPGWVFDMTKSGGGYAGTAVRFGNPNQRTNCSAYVKNEQY